jgi:hypothetical protein
VQADVDVQIHLILEHREVFGERLKCLRLAVKLLRGSRGLASG